MTYIKLTIRGSLETIRMPIGTFTYEDNLDGSYLESPGVGGSWQVQETPEQIDQLIRDAGGEVVGLDSLKPLKLPEVGRAYKDNLGLCWKVVKITDDHRVLLTCDETSMTATCNLRDFWIHHSEIGEVEKADSAPFAIPGCVYEAGGLLWVVGSIHQDGRVEYHRQDDAGRSFVMDPEDFEKFFKKVEK